MSADLQKVNTGHLKRNACLYIRQSTLRQVLENTESTKCQYALRQRAVALGWSSDCIVVIDSDLGQSGATSADREGFQKLVAEVDIGPCRTCHRIGSLPSGPELERLAQTFRDLRAH